MDFGSILRSVGGQDRVVIPSRENDQSLVGLAAPGVQPVGVRRVHEPVIRGMQLLRRGGVSGELGPLIEASNCHRRGNIGDIATNLLDAVA